MPLNVGDTIVPIHACGFIPQVTRITIGGVRPGLRRPFTCASEARCDPPWGREDWLWSTPAPRLDDGPPTSRPVTCPFSVAAIVWPRSTSGAERSAVTPALDARPRFENEWETIQL